MNIGTQTYTNNYPTIFVHGFLGWGSEDKIDKVVHYWGAAKNRDLLAEMREEGYEVYNPSVGPFNSAWDRACELYARLLGGRVDYGAAHSKRYGHSRYGRTYPGILKDWGTPGNHSKINLIGHSFGGPTVRVFANLCSQGDEEEQQATPANEISGLFTGGKACRIHTVTTLSGVNNGTTYDSLHGEAGIRTMAGLMLAQISQLGDSKFMKFKDYHFDQWGVMDPPDKVKKSHLRLAGSQWKKIRKFLNTELDNVGYEMGLEGMYEINRDIKPAPNMYFFARRACRTHPDNNGNEIPDHNMSAFCQIPGFLSGRYRSDGLAKYGFNDKWLPNDGFVNVVGHSAPLDEPFMDWNPTVSIRPGVWYNMPVEDKDHMSWMGFGEKTTVLYRYYDQMLSLFRMLPDGDAETQTAHTPEK